MLDWQVKEKPQGPVCLPVIRWTQGGLLQVEAKATHEGGGEVEAGEAAVPVAEVKGEGKVWRQDMRCWKTSRWSARQ